MGAAAAATGGAHPRDGWDSQCRGCTGLSGGMLEASWKLSAPATILIPQAHFSDSPASEALGSPRRGSAWPAAPAAAPGWPGRGPPRRAAARQAACACGTGFPWLAALLRGLLVYVELWGGTGRRTGEWLQPDDGSRPQAGETGGAAVPPPRPPQAGPSTALARSFNACLRTSEALPSAAGADGSPGRGSWGAGPLCALARAQCWVCLAEISSNNTQLASVASREGVLAMH